MEKGRIANVIAAFLILLGAFLVIQQSEQNESEKYPINFYSFEEGLEVARKENKPVLVYIHSDTCHVCRAFLEDLSKYDDLKKAMERFVVVKVDFNKERLLAMKFGATGTPEFHILNPDGSPLVVDGKRLVYIGYSNTPNNEMARRSLISFFDFAVKKFGDFSQ